MFITLINVLQIFVSVNTSKSILLLCICIDVVEFFYNRVLNEEVILLKFFGEDYVKYQEKVGTGLPFISGYKYSL